MNSYETIKNYLTEMLSWEVNFYKTTRSDNYKNNIDNCRGELSDLARDELRKIISNYLSEKALTTIGEAKILALGIGRPPIYDQKLESDFEEKIKTAVVISERGSGGMSSPFCKFSLILEDGRWKIKEIHYSHDKLEWKKAKSL